MATVIGLNGFGRIGRTVARLLYSDFAKKKGLELKLGAINDLGNTGTLAHLFKYDSVHGIFKGEVKSEDQVISINGDNIKVFSEKEPARIPWREIGVDIVLECTGIFTKRDQAAQHIKGGARKVIISAPSPDADYTVAYGINHFGYQASAHEVVSCASCTTNSLAPVASVLLNNFGLERGSMTTVHSFTNDQRILDLPHKDLRRARAATLSMIPTTTGAAKAIGLVIPELTGKLDGFAIRVPTANVSVVDLVAQVSRKVTSEEVNNAFRKSSENELKGVLGFSAEPLVSIDYIGSTYSSIVDSLSTMVIGENLVKVLSWYDNETGFSARMLDTADFMASKF
jgi:glyceraldehyde 3-phosphate dehydrogenase